MTTINSHGLRPSHQLLAERAEVAADDPWWPIPACEVPAAIRFDTTRRDQGQIVEVSYGTFSRAEADRSDPYRRVTDRSDSPVEERYYKRREVLDRPTPTKEKTCNT